jgi:dGTPase
MSHSLEVSNIAAQMANMFFQSGKNTLINDMTQYENLRLVLYAACLIHDIGHPPFAHAGEEEIGNSDRLKRVFDSNVNNLRILTGLSPRTAESKLELRSATIDAALKKKHLGPFSSPHFANGEIEKIDLISSKNGTIISRDDFDRMYKGNCDNKGRYEQLLPNSNKKIFLRSPLAYLMETADDISYITSDIEDALSQKTISLKDIYEILKSCTLLDKLLGSSYKTKYDENNFLKESNYSSIKASMIRMFMVEIHTVFSAWLQNIQKDDIDNLPSFLLHQSILSYLNEQNEFGNLLYMGSNGNKFYKLKKETQKIIFRSNNILESNARSAKTINYILNTLLPENRENDSKKIFEIGASFIDPEYASAIYKELNSPKISSSSISKIENYFIDYISSLTDQRALDLEKRLMDSILFQKQAA